MHRSVAIKIPTPKEGQNDRPPQWEQPKTFDSSALFRSSVKSSGKNETGKKLVAAETGAKTYKALPTKKAPTNSAVDQKIQLDLLQAQTVRDLPQKDRQRLAELLLRLAASEKEKELLMQHMAAERDRFEQVLDRLQKVEQSISSDHAKPSENTNTNVMKTPPKEDKIGLSSQLAVEAVNTSVQTGDILEVSKLKQKLQKSTVLLTKYQAQVKVLKEDRFNLMQELHNIRSVPHTETGHQTLSLNNSVQHIDSSAIDALRAEISRLNQLVTSAQFQKSNVDTAFHATIFSDGMPKEDNESDMNNRSIKSAEHEESKSLVSPSRKAFKDLVSRIMAELNGNPSNSDNNSSFVEDKVHETKPSDPESISKNPSIQSRVAIPSVPEVDLNINVPKIIPDHCKPPIEELNDKFSVPSSPAKSVYDYRREFLPEEDNNFFVPLPDQTLPHAYLNLPPFHQKPKNTSHQPSNLFPEDTSMVQSLADIVDALNYGDNDDDAQTETDLLLRDFTQWRLGNLDHTSVISTKTVEDDDEMLDVISNLNEVLF